jgi:hypothetical protein
MKHTVRRTANDYWGILKNPSGRQARTMEIRGAVEVARAAKPHRNLLHRSPLRRLARLSQREVKNDDFLRVLPPPPALKANEYKINIQEIDLVSSQRNFST